MVTIREMIDSAPPPIESDISSLTWLMMSRISLRSDFGVPAPGFEGGHFFFEDDDVVTGGVR